jgi:hypothetical protein
VTDTCEECGDDSAAEGYRYCTDCLPLVDEYDLLARIHAAAEAWIGTPVGGVLLDAHEAIIRLRSEVSVSQQ